MFVIILPLILLLVYLYFTKNHDYWEKRNVKHERPVPFFGNLFQCFIGTKNFIDMATELYNKYPDEKVVGLYHGTIPELIIKDLELVRKILTVDFAYFNRRGLGRDTKQEPVFLNLFHGEGDNWKLLRQRLTPAFTTAKLKKMFPLVVECAEKLQLVCEDIVKKGDECDVRELMARFTTEFIGACGFGIQMDTINNENSDFRNVGKRMFDRNRSWRNTAIVVLYNLLPDFRTLLQTMLKESEMLDIMKELFENVSTERNNKPSGRHDFIDLLLELQQKGTITGESIEKTGSDGKPLHVELEMDEDCMAAQIFIFFAAGFETSSSATSYMLYELAFHPDEQKKIQEDIDHVLAKYGNKLCYDSIAEMQQLNMGFKEAMRMLPSPGSLNRECSKRYTIPELGISLDPGVKIIIPLNAIQNDEKYFDNPSVYNPERFADLSEGRHKYAYLPFGVGPRACIGARLGEMQSLAGLAALLHKFSVEPGPSTKRVLEMNPYSNVIQSVKGGLPLKLKLRKKDSDVVA